MDVSGFDGSVVEDLWDISDECEDNERHGK